MKVTSTPKAPAAIGPYSQAISANGFLFTSGQIAIIPETGEIDGTTIESQAERCCMNLKALLEENGLGFESVVKTVCFLVLHRQARTLLRGGQDAAEKRPLRDRADRRAMILFPSKQPPCQHGGCLVSSV